VGEPASSCAAESANLNVQLVHQCDQSPLNGGTVTLSGPESKELTTGADGWANFEGVTPGDYTINGIHPQHQPGSTTGTATAGATTPVTLPLQGIVAVGAAQAAYTVVLDKPGNAPAAFPILQFQITNGPPNHLFDLQLSRGGTGDLTGGPGLANSWVETDGRDARMNRTVFSTWSNNQTALMLDGSGNATYTMPLEWWRDQARQTRASFTEFKYFFRVVAWGGSSSSASPTICTYSSADGSSAVPSVTLRNNLVAFAVTDNGYVSGGTAKSITMSFTVREAGTTSMFTFVQWKVGGRENWSGSPAVMTRPTVQDYNVVHESNYPVSQIDRVRTDPRYHDDTYTISPDRLSATSSDAPNCLLDAGVTNTFTHIDFETRVHLNFEVPAAVTISRQDGAAPVFGVVTGVLADPQPIKLDSGTWATRVLRVRQADGSEGPITHPDTFAGP
jgi:hypothetical protein